MRDQKLNSNTKQFLDPNETGFPPNELKSQGVKKPKDRSARQYQWPLLLLFYTTQLGTVSFRLKFKEIVRQGKVPKR